MRVKFTTELEFQSCGHSGSCPCVGTVCGVEVEGTAYDTEGDVEVEVTDVTGLPGWMSFGDLSPDALEQLTNELAQVAMRRFDRLERLPSEVRALAATLRRLETTDGVARALIQDAARQLEELTQEAA